MPGRAIQVTMQKKRKKNTVFRLRVKNRQWTGVTGCGISVIRHWINNNEQLRENKLKGVATGSKTAIRRQRDRPKTGQNLYVCIHTFLARRSQSGVLNTRDGAYPSNKFRYNRRAFGFHSIWERRNNAKREFPNSHPLLQAFPRVNTPRSRFIVHRLAGPVRVSECNESFRVREWNFVCPLKYSHGNVRDSLRGEKDEYVWTIVLNSRIGVRARV